MDYVKVNSEIWDNRGENNDIWSIPVSKETIELARNGIWNIVLTPFKTVPMDWFARFAAMGTFRNALRRDRQSAIAHRRRQSALWHPRSRCGRSDPGA